MSPSYGKQPLSSNAKTQPHKKRKENINTEVCRHSLDVLFSVHHHNVVAQIPLKLEAQLNPLFVSY